jgi:agmatine deiminase
MAALEPPASQGYRMPAEWEPHEATWLAWPHHRDDWPGRFGPIPWVYVDIVRHLARHELVRILVPNGRLQRDATERLERAGVDLDRVQFYRAKTDRSWTRDYVPSFVVRDASRGQPPGVGLVDWEFNAWAKYDNFHHDERIGRKLANALDLPRWVPRIEREGEPARVVLEGGAIDVNGQGTLLTTEECLLDEVQARNPGASKADLERILADYLGARHVIWLGKGIAGDDTHGHVDDLARFVGPRTVAAVVERDPADVNFGPLQDNLNRLQSATDQDGLPLEVVPLPMPNPVVFDGQRLPASYANFYIANGVVLVPTFNDPADRVAIEAIEPFFPDRTVIGIHALDLVWGFGTVHCMTHEQPAVPA